MLVTGANLPLSFIATGLTALAISVILLVASPGTVLLPLTHPHFIAHAHLWLPGFLLTVSMGAMYQMMPVALATPLSGSAITAWIHLGLHAAGLVALVGGFFLGRFEIVAIGGTAVALGVGLLAHKVVGTFQSGRRRDATAWCFPLAAGWLLVTVLLGVFMAVNRRWGFVDVSALTLLRAHAHLGLAGFFLTLLQGATFQLVPMFTLGSAQRPRHVTASVACAQGGLPLLAFGWLAATPWLVTTGAVLLTAALVCGGLALQATLRTRTRRTLEPGVRAFLVGLILLAITPVAGFPLLFGLLPVEQYGKAYGITLVCGGLGLTVLGMLCKIVPFLTWMRTYGPRVGRGAKLPTASQLGSRRLERVGFWLYLAALVCVLPSVILSSDRGAAVGIFLLTAAVGLLLTDLLRVLHHIRKPISG